MNVSLWAITVFAREKVALPLSFERSPKIMYLKAMFVVVYTKEIVVYTIAKKLWARGMNKNG